MTNYKKEIDEEERRIDELIERSRRYDIFAEARIKLKELKESDHSIEELTLHFHSNALGKISVPIRID